MAIEHSTVITIPTRNMYNLCLNLTWQLSKTALFFTFFFLIDYLNKNFDIIKTNAYK